MADVPEDPPEDIPAWFMTYSDVITLLMTFFILLLTFSTTEPERFEKIAVSLFGSSGATGVAGHKHDKLDRDSWATRVRPRAARIATDGSEMPPRSQETSGGAVGRGLARVNEEQAKRDVMKSYAFELTISEIVSKDLSLTQRGVQIAGLIGPRLLALPVHCTLEFHQSTNPDPVITLGDYLMYTKGVRPGQIAYEMTESVSPGKLRVIIERYEQEQ